ncbi:MAG: hypothetical protein ACRCXM_17780 [Beijerinckiaceae bacterium]
MRGVVAAATAAAAVAAVAAVTAGAVALTVAGVVPIAADGALTAVGAVCMRTVTSAAAGARLVDEPAEAASMTGPTIAEVFSF